MLPEVNMFLQLNIESGLVRVESRKMLNGAIFIYNYETVNLLDNFYVK